MIKTSRILEGDLINQEVVNKKSRGFPGFWVANGTRTHDPQNHNLML
jgi:hypothetical protein